MAAECLLELEPHDAAVYVLLADLYAKRSQWERVKGGGDEGEDPGEERGHEDPGLQPH